MLDRRACLAALLGSAVWSGCGGETTHPPAGAGPSLRRVRLQLNWFPEVEHGGYYTALVAGYYREEGLDVEIQPGGPNVPVVQMTADGQAEFGVANADPILFGRAEGALVTALMAPLQVSPRCIMVHEESGIKDFTGLRDVTLAMSSTSAFSHFLRARFPLSGVRIVPYPGSVAPFLGDSRYAQQGYVFSEPHLARAKGAKPRVLMVSDAGFNPYTSCLIARDELIASDPELVEKMVRASVRGWENYLASPAEANRRIGELNPEMEAEILRLGAEDMKPLVKTDETEGSGLGTMTAARWKELVAQLEEIGQLKPGKVRPEGAFTTRFLPRPTGSAASERP